MLSPKQNEHDEWLVALVPVPVVMPCQPARHRGLPGCFPTGGRVAGSRAVSPRQSLRGRSGWAATGGPSIPPV